MRASEIGHLPVAERLIGAKADVNAKAVSKENQIFRTVFVSFATNFLFETAYACICKHDVTFCRRLVSYSSACHFSVCFSRLCSHSHMRKW